MKTSIFLLFLLALASVVNAGVNYFKKPDGEKQVYGTGSNVEFVVAQLPDIDGQPILANVYQDGRDRPFAKIREWAASSVSDSDKNDFTFTWEIPREFPRGFYFVKIDIANDQDDNDIFRSRTFEIVGSAVGGGGGALDSGFVGGGNNGYTGGSRAGWYDGNTGMKTAARPGSAYEGYNGGNPRYSRFTGGGGNNGGSSGSGGIGGGNSRYSRFRGGNDGNQRYEGNMGGNGGGRGGNSYSAIHLRRAK